MSNLNMSSFMGLKTTDSIKNVTNTIYYIAGSSAIDVKDSNVAIIDVTNKSNVTINVCPNSTVNYFTLDSSDTKRVFNVEGTLNYTCISTKQSNEELIVELLKREAMCDINVLSIAAGYDSLFTQRVNHSCEGTKSNVKNVCVAYNKSNLVFDTTGYIQKGMKNSLCQQISRGVVMDDESSITAKPILLIDEFDCFANHGASIGKISDEDLFYLMSRGLSKNEAFLLILKGIIRPFIESMPTEELKSSLDNEISNLIEK